MKLSHLVLGGVIALAADEEQFLSETGGFSLDFVALSHYGELLRSGTAEAISEMPSMLLLADTGQETRGWCSRSFNFRAAQALLVR